MRTKLISVMLLFVFLLSACGTGDSSKKSKSFPQVTESTLGQRHGKDPLPSEGFDGKTINLGVIGPISGLAGLLGNTVISGAQLYWDEKNTQGGVSGKYKVNIIKKDSALNDGYDRALSIDAYKEIKSQVVSFQMVLGTDVVLALREDQLRDKKVISPATLAGEWVRDPLTLAIASPYQNQAINGVAYFAEHTDIVKPKICTLSMDDSYGESGVEGTKFITDKMKLDLVAQEKFTPLNPVSSQVDNLLKAQCNAIVLSATAVDVAGILSTFAERNADVTLIGLAPLWIPEVDFRLTPNSRNYAKDHMWVVSTGAPWGDMNVKGVAQMMNALAQFKPKQTSNPYFAYGYAQAWAMDQLLEQAVANGDLSPNGVASAIANVGTFNFDGLIPSYEYGPNINTRKVPPQNTIFKYDINDVSRLSPLSSDSVDYASKYVSKFVYK